MGVHKNGEVPNILTETFTAKMFSSEQNTNLAHKRLNKTLKRVRITIAGLLKGYNGKGDDEWILRHMRKRNDISPMK